MTSLIRTRTLASALSLAALAACGGGGGGPATGTLPNAGLAAVHTSGPLLTGQVIDGYLEGARVCLDLDDSGTCGDAEPAATTGAAGRYTLPLGGVVSPGRYLLVEVPPSARDSDHGGLTLAEAGHRGYSLAAPVERGGHITPLTTMVVGKLKAGLAHSLASAEQAVIQDLRLPAGANLWQNPLHDPDLRRKARQIALQLQAHAGPNASERWAQVARHLASHTAAMPLPGDLRSAGSLPAATGRPLAFLAHQADGLLLTYSLPGTRDGQPMDATAVLLTPRQAPPAGGWPLAVLGGATPGVASHCAPSLGRWDAAQLQWVADLLARNMAVVVPDLEGRGPASLAPHGAHPFLHLGSAGRAMALAALASRQHLGARLSGAWAAAGQGQGGHAALAAAQFSGLASGMHYRGTVAAAPYSGLLPRIGKALATAGQARYGQTHDAYLALAHVGVLATAMAQGSAATDQALDPDALLRAGLPDAPRMPPVLGLREIHDRSRLDCHDQLQALVHDDVTHYAFRNHGSVDYPGLQAQALALPAVAAYFNASEPGTVRLPGRTLLLQGQSDAVVHPASTELLLELMKRKGSDVSLLRYGGLGHAELPADARVRSDAMTFLASLLGT